MVVQGKMIENAAESHTSGALCWALFLFAGYTLYFLVN
jgi:hypothetical protein